MDIAPEVITALQAVWQFLSKNWATFVSAGAGTFSGAYLAFKFERDYKERKEKTTHLLSGKKAQFALAARITLLKNMKKNYLDPKRTDPDRTLMLVPLSVFSRPPAVDFATVSFLLEDDGAELLNKLVITDQRFDSCLGTLEQRNVRHEQAQRQLASSSPPSLDKATHAILKDMTDALYGGVDDTIASYELRITELAEYLQRRFPKGRVLKIEHLY